MKRLTILFNLLLIVTFFTLAQTDNESQSKKSSVTASILEMGLGLGNSFSFHIGGGKYAYFGFGWHHQLFKGTKGEYYEVVNWDQFPEDHKNEGSYYNVYLLKLGGSFKEGGSSFYANIGLNAETRYRNCFDDYHILGDNGKYFKTTSGTVSFAYGVGGVIKVGDDMFAVGGDISLGKYTSVTISNYISTRW